MAVLPCVRLTCRGQVAALVQTLMMMLWMLTKSHQHPVAAEGDTQVNAQTPCAERMCVCAQQQLRIASSPNGRMA